MDDCSSLSADCRWDTSLFSRLDRADTVDASAFWFTAVIKVFTAD